MFKFIQYMLVVIKVYVLLSVNQTLFCFCFLTYIFWLILESKQYDFGNKVTKRSCLVISQRYTCDLAIKTVLLVKTNVLVTIQTFMTVSTNNRVPLVQL